MTVNIQTTATSVEDAKELIDGLIEKEKEYKGFCTLNIDISVGSVYQAKKSPIRKEYGGS